MAVGSSDNKVHPSPAGPSSNEEKTDTSAEASTSGISTNGVDPAPPPNRVMRRKSTNLAHLTVRQRIYHTMEDPSSSQLAQIISLSIMFLITVSTITFILETEYTDPELRPLWYTVESIAVVVFTIEYLTKLATCPNTRVFIFTPMNLIDLAAILPYWLNLSGAMDSGGVGFIRAVRLVRIFRIFKFGRYSTGIQMFAGAILHSLQSLGILAFMVVIAMVLFSSAIYFCESGVPIEERSKPEAFDSIPSSFWWCIVTLTTVGYGDHFPVTGSGKVVATLCMFAGIMIVALPITVLGSSFTKMVEMYDEDEKLLHSIDTNADGSIDEMELRTFLLAHKKTGMLRLDTDTRASHLMEKYDHSGKGFLNAHEFKNLQHDVLTNVSAAEQEAMRQKICMNELANMMLEEPQYQREIEERIERLEGLVMALCKKLAAVGVAPKAPTELPKVVGGPTNIATPTKLAS